MNTNIEKTSSFRQNSELRTKDDFDQYNKEFRVFANQIIKDGTAGKYLFEAGILTKNGKLSSNYK